MSGNLKKMLSQVSLLIPLILSYMSHTCILCKLSEVTVVILFIMKTIFPHFSFFQNGKAGSSFSSQVQVCAKVLRIKNWMESESY